MLNHFNTAVKYQFVLSYSVSASTVSLVFTDISMTKDLVVTEIDFVRLSCIPWFLRSTASESDELLMILTSPQQCIVIVFLSSLAAEAKEAAG